MSNQPTLKDDHPPRKHEAKDLTRHEDDGSKMPADAGGEDEGSAPIEGDDDHLKKDQKPIDR